MRAFIAVHLEETLKPEVEKVQEALRKAGGRLRYTRSDALHFTLAFLGEIEEDDPELLVPELENQVQDTRAFSLEISGFGTFPPGRNPKVFWLGVGEGRNHLMALQEQVVRALDSAGMDFDRKPFHPHLTVARPRDRGGQGFRWPERLHDTIVGAMTVESVALVRSDLTPEGPVYTDLAQIPLEKPA